MASIAFDAARHNADIFDSAGVAAWYARQNLYPAEQAYLAAYADEIRDRPILDLGVGSGRTTEPLLALSDDYVGVDLSLAMLDAARESYPDATLLHMDVREIGVLGRGRFGFVHGGLAIISAFTHDERLALLAAMREALTPDGLLIFSAHNRAWKRAGGTPLHARSWTPRNIVDSIHPLSWYNYFRLRHVRAENDDHAILVDAAHRWQGVFYFIDFDAQKRQLEDAGFDLIDAFGEDGRRVSAGDDLSGDGLLHFVCRPVAGD